jgi:hypothetical protein
MSTSDLRNRLFSDLLTNRDKVLLGAIANVTLIRIGQLLEGDSGGDVGVRITVLAIVNG